MLAIYLFWFVNSHSNMHKLLFLVVMASLGFIINADPIRPKTIFFSGSAVFDRGDNNKTYSVDIGNSLLREDSYLHDGGKGIVIYDFSKLVKYLILAPKEGSITCKKGYLRPSENPLSLNMFANATYQGVTTVRDHTVHTWANTHVFWKNQFTYMDTTTGLVVRISDFGDSNTDVTIISTKVPDPTVFIVPPDILPKCL
jgi:hypothetical protein